MALLGEILWTERAKLTSLFSRKRERDNDVLMGSISREGVLIMHMIKLHCNDLLLSFFLFFFFKYHQKQNTIIPMTSWEPKRMCWSHSLIEQDIVLWAHPQVLPDAVHVSADVISIDESCSWCRREQSCQDWPAEKRGHKQHTRLRD